MKNNSYILVALMVLTSGVFAQTGGPGQPEFMQFQQAGTEGLVNPSTGSFSYQIPLFTIGGYPMNLTYQAGIQMEDVSTMVGLGWNLNAGTIVRSLRGLPDDFNGDEIEKQFSVKDNETFGGKFDLDLEIAGIPGVSSVLLDMLGAGASAGLGLYYNNYKGWGVEASLQSSLSANLGCVQGTAGLGLSANSQNGVDKYSFRTIALTLGKGQDKLSVSLGKTHSVNSVEGLSKSLNTGLSYTRYSDSKTTKTLTGGEKTKVSRSNSISLLGYSKRSSLNNAFQPDIEYPFLNSSFTFSGSIGWDAYTVDPGIRTTGYYSKQSLERKVQHFPAYGIMYETDQLPPNALMDFNREKKLPYYAGESKILPVPYKTPDVFNLNAQGISMTFSVYKNDIGIVGDPRNATNSSGLQGGAEAHLGGLFKAGANIGTTISNQYSKRWLPSELTDYLKFKPEQDTFLIANSPNLYQQFVFKNHGETNRFDHSMFDHLNGYNRFSFIPLNEKYLAGFYKNGSPIRTNYFNKHQPVRLTTINYLTADEADEIGFDKKIHYYRIDDNSPIEHTMDRIDTDRKAHHLSEISVTQPDGMRYIFGIPVYNTIQKEVTFNVGVKNPSQEKNLVNYSGNDNSIGNQLGIDQYFESMITPAYATQLLITAVLSPDYRDITGDGISADDVGNYVKFSYFKEDSLYRWRSPFEKDSATYNRGLRSDSLDDKGTYVYGEKELWYLRSVESKTEIALFFYSIRQDGYGVKGENGGRDPNMFLRKLDSIMVFSMQDYSINHLNATPIQTIHFEYDQSLCKNVNNASPAGQGKLTLKEVAITYENSRKGLLTPYSFEYGKMPDGTEVNPDYSTRDVNRWGYYQKNPDNAYSDCDYDSPLSNIDYPYSSQDRGMMNKNAYAWNLTDIIIPGGGKIKAEYEAHDYAYVQDKQAGQMFLVKGLNNVQDIGLDNKDLKIYFDLPVDVKDKWDLQKKYLLDIATGGPYLYYKFYVKLRGNKCEYVTGYAEVADWGIHVSKKYGWLQLKNVELDDDKPENPTNTIHKSAIQFMRINRNSLIFSKVDTIPSGDVDGFIKGLPSAFGALTHQLKASASGGLNKYCMNQGFCGSIDLTKSFIRLYNPTRDKLAGGSRVARISINDQFGGMTSGVHQSKAYITSYYYTTEEIDPSGGVLDTISSGVADYEPMIGGDEISLKRPIFYSDPKKKAPDNDFYVEEPVNESNFPSPQIIYSKVTMITNEDGDGVGKTGKVVNEFFTARDFPVKVTRTSVMEKRKKSEGRAFSVPFVGNNQQFDFANVTQGYSIELNNMSGMPKATWVYNENGDRISGETFEYAPDNDHFTTLDRRGRVHRNTILGISVDYTIDGKVSYDKMKNHILNVNVNTIMIIAPFPIPIPLYTRVSEEKQFQSIVTNKIIHRNVLMKRHTVYSQTAAVSTENLAYDHVTGEVLLTLTTNEFSDSLYSFSYPAWWMYPGMGPAYENTKLKINSNNLSLYAQFLKAGDELRSTTGQRLWSAENTSSFLKSNNDNSGLNTYEYQVYQSGAKNLLNDKAGQVITWNYNPLSNGEELAFDQYSILNSSVIEYHDEAVRYCAYCPSVIESASDTSSTISFPDPPGNQLTAPEQLQEIISPPEPVVFPVPEIVPEVPIPDTNIYQIEPQLFEFTPLESVDTLNLQLLPPDTALLNYSPGSIPQIGIQDMSDESHAALNQSSTIGSLEESEMASVSALLNWHQKMTTFRNYGLLYHPGLSSFADLSMEDNNFVSDGAPAVSTSHATSPNPAPPDEPENLTNAINPFLSGIKGTWKPKTSRFFLVERTHGDLDIGLTDIRTQGLFKGYNDFWVIPPAESNVWGKVYTNWEWNETVNLVDVDGQIIETEDRIGRKTTSLLGYKNTVILAQASNAGYHENYYEGFEDYFNSFCPPDFMDFSKRINTGGNAYISNSVSHSGKYSLYIHNQVTLSPLLPLDEEPFKCIGGWYPYHEDSDMNYLFSCWVKVDKAKPVLSCNDASVAITSAGQTITLRPEGPVIEGWQRVMGTFVVAKQNVNVTISLNKGTAATFYDDIRITPFDANMIAYVYDDLNLRLTHILDENNYFTKYEYNNQGELIRIKKETEEGILTLQEAYQSLIKKR